MAEPKAQGQAGPRLLCAKELGRDHYPFSWFPKLPYYSESFGCKGEKLNSDLLEQNNNSEITIHNM